MPIYLKIGSATNANGGSVASDITVDDRNAIRGNSTDPAHLNWIPVAACRFETPTKGPLTSVACQRSMDGTSVDIFKASHSGRPMAAIIEFVSPKEPSQMLRVKLASVIVTSYSASSRGPGTVEGFDLNFASIYIEYVKVNPDPTDTDPNTIAADLLGIAPI